MGPVFTFATTPRALFLHQLPIEGIPAKPLALLTMFGGMASNGIGIPAKGMARRRGNLRE
jgi:hypothetical protein